MADCEAPAPRGARTHSVFAGRNFKKNWIPITLDFQRNAEPGTTKKGSARNDGRLAPIRILV